MAAGATVGRTDGERTAAAATGIAVTAVATAGVGAAIGARLAAGDTDAEAGFETCCSARETPGPESTAAAVGAGLAAGLSFFSGGGSAAAGRGDEPRVTGVESACAAAAARVLRAGFEALLLRRVGPAEVEVEVESADAVCPELRSVDPGPEVSEVSAHAVPVAIAAPIPSATASAPTRPMCPAAARGELASELIGRHSCG
jgi:hypothetical protein